jgi:hypothetical protein
MKKFCSICGKAYVEKFLLTSSYWECPDEELHRQARQSQPPPIPQQTMDGDFSGYEDIFLNGLRRSIKNKIKYSSHEIDLAIEDMMDAIRSERGMLSGNEVFEYEKQLIDFVNDATAEDLEMMLRPSHYGIAVDDGWPGINWDMD